MERSLSLKSLTFAAAFALAGFAGAQSYFSSDNLVCSPDYHSTSPMSYTLADGSSMQLSLQDLHIDSSRFSPPTDSSLHVYDFSADCRALRSSIGSQASEFGTCKFSVSMQFVGQDSTGASDYAMQLNDFSVSLSDYNADGRFDLRESPTKSSTGLMSIYDEAPKETKTFSPYTTSGGYMISSFFDVYTEVSLDNGATWTPSNGSSRFQGTPEPASIAAMGLGFVGLCRRRLAKKN